MCAFRLCDLSSPLDFLQASSFVPCFLQRASSGPARSSPLAWSIPLTLVRLLGLSNSPSPLSSLSSLSSPLDRHLVHPFSRCFSSFNSKMVSLSFCEILLFVGGVGCRVLGINFVRSTPLRQLAVFPCRSSHLAAGRDILLATTLRNASLPVLLPSATSHDLSQSPCPGSARGRPRESARAPRSDNRRMKSWC